MDDRTLRRRTGSAAVATSTFFIAVAPLYFVYSGPPPQGNVIVRSLLTIAGFVALIAFVAGLQALMRRARPDEEITAGFLGLLSAVWVAVTIVATAMEAGAVLGRAERIDPTLIGSGAEGALVIYGPFGRILTAAFLATCSVAIARTGVLPRWLGRTALALAVLQLAFVATFFSDTDPSRFLSVNGWHLPIVGSLLMLWILTAGITLLRPAGPPPRP